MREDERLSTLISDIYDAALDASLWPAVLGRTADFCNAWQAALFWKDATSKSGGVSFDNGVMERHYVQLYFDKYLKYDPTTTAQFFSPLEGLTSTEDIMSYDEFVGTRFYREWAKPQQLADCVNAVLDRSATSIAIFGTIRHESQGLCDDELRRCMSLLVPHIRRAVLIGRAMDLSTTELENFADCVDGLSAAMFLVQGDGRIVYGNVAGHAMLADGRILSGPGGRLTAHDAAANRLLEESIGNAGHADPGAKGITIPLGDGRDQHVTHLLPLTSGARRRAGTRYAAVAAVFVQKAALDLPSPPQVIARAYGLTPTELRVLLAAVDVGGAREVAEALGIAESTVKTHLKRLRTKTGCRRQAELVKLVAGYSGAVAP